MSDEHDTFRGSWKAADDTRCGRDVIGVFIPGSKMDRKSFDSYLPFMFPLLPYVNRFTNLKKSQILIQKKPTDMEVFEWRTKCLKDGMSTLMYVTMHDSTVQKDTSQDWVASLAISDMKENILFTVWMGCGTSQAGSITKRGNSLCENLVLSSGWFWNHRFFSEPTLLKERYSHGVTAKLS